MTDRLLLGLLAGAALFGTLLALELKPGAAAAGTTAMPAPASAEAHPEARRPRQRIEELVATALARPLFSTTRRPPTDAGRQDPDIANLRLTGIVIQPDRRLAIFAIPHAKPLVRSQGEMVKEWRVDRIARHEVLLTSRARAVTLKPQADPTLIRSPRVPRPRAKRSLHNRPAAAPGPPSIRPPSLVTARRSGSH